MRRTTSQADIKERKEIWRGIRLLMEKQELTPRELAQRTKYPQDRLERGIRGEPEPIMHALGDFVDAFNLRSSRVGRFYEETTEVLSEEELKALLKPPPPRQRKLWDD